MPDKPSSPPSPTPSNAPNPVPPRHSIRTPLKEGWPTADRPPAGHFDPHKALRNYRPVWPWESEPMTPRQAGYLWHLAAVESAEWTKGQAVHLINAILKGPPTYEQWHRLKIRGLWRDGITFQEARSLCASF
jgi:hypothetical protein